MANKTKLGFIALLVERYVHSKIAQVSDPNLKRSSHVTVLRLAKRCQQI